MADEARDPLSYFAAYGSSSSESDSDSAEDQPPAPGPGVSARSEAGDGPRESGAALPAPDELFSSVSRPRFLSNPLREQIDWGRRLVRAPEEPPKEFKVWKTIAVPPPESYTTEEKKPPPGVDMAVKWSSMYQDNGDDAPNRLPIASDLLPGELAASESDEEDEATSAKKRKTESFQQKEKRKRNDGQANREKSFVEEEKRILRQDFRLKD